MQVLRGFSRTASAAFIIGTLVASFGLAGSFAAEPRAGMMGANGMGPMMGGPGMMDGTAMERMNGPGPFIMGRPAIDHIEGRIAFLKAELKLTAQQDAPWNNFAAALRTNATDIAKLHEDAILANTKIAQPSVSRLEFVEHTLATRLAGMHAITVSYSALYASLSEDQKNLADSLVGAGPMHGMMPMARRVP